MNHIINCDQVDSLYICIAFMKNNQRLSFWTSYAVNYYLQSSDTSEPRSLQWWIHWHRYDQSSTVVYIQWINVISGLITKICYIIIYRPGDIRACSPCVVKEGLFVSFGDIRLVWSNRYYSRYQKIVKHNVAHLSTLYR